tara:strand:- start:3603 stop:3764 length:162 start_codon:yes stop_codon:yes gene_type:complete
MEDFEPFTLTYTWNPKAGPAIKISVFCGDPGKADDEFSLMFRRCGRNVEYSVD